jgi:hypothetical protein
MSDQGPEREVLLKHLNSQREHVLGILEGLTELDAAPRQAEAWWAESGMDFPDLRAILVHVLTETAVHAGHLDAVRELIDGRQWIVL